MGPDRPCPVPSCDTGPIDDGARWWHTASHVCNTTTVGEGKRGAGACHGAPHTPAKAACQPMHRTHVPSLGRVLATWWVLCSPCSQLLSCPARHVSIWTPMCCQVEHSWPWPSILPSCCIRRWVAYLHHYRFWSVQRSAKRVDC